MLLKDYCGHHVFKWRALTKTCLPVRQALLIMKFTAILLLAATITATANGYAQNVTLSEKKAPLEKLFKEIRKQTQYVFFYDASILTVASPITINIKNVTVEDALKEIFKDQPLEYSIENKTITVVKKADKAPVLQSGDEKKEKLLPPPPITVRGRITNENDEGVVVTVVVKGTQNGTTSNAEGYYELSNVDENATLVISGVSIETQEVKVNNRTAINVTTKIKVAESEEVIVAYNKISQRSNTGAIAVVKGTQIQNLPSRSFDKSLQGLVPGLLVTQGSGLPGSGVANFVLRGIATAADPALGNSVRNPLIVIDGVPVSQDQFQMYYKEVRTPITNPLSQLNPSDIESISVLKDASAIALYGARASNGVIVVTTKKGKMGKIQIGFRSQLDIASVFKGKTKLVNQQEYLELLFESYRNLNSPLYPDDAAIYADLRTKFPIIVNAPGDTSFYPETDWYKELLQKNAMTISSEVTISGGSDKSNYYLNLEYTKQNGIVKATDYDRKSLRFNFENQPASWLKLGLNTSFSYNKQNYGSGTLGFDGTVANAISPLNPVRDIGGNYIFNYRAGGGPQSSALYPNPVAAAEFNINRNTSYRGLTNLNAEVTFLKHFKFTTIAGFDFMLAESKEKSDPRFVDPGSIFESGIGRIEEQNVRRANLVSTNMLRYIRTVGRDHSINFLIGQEAQVQTQKQSLIAVQRLPWPHYDEINSPGVLPFRQSSSSFKETLLSYFGQGNYGYKNKYFLTASIRRDGSSRFGEDRRYGTYWSAGAGWVITGEKFMELLSSTINYLKLRGSIGAAGNAGAINANTKFDRLVHSNFLGGPALLPTEVPGNPDVQWEQTFTWDAGLESRFWKDRISLTADIYKRKTKDLIFPVKLSAGTGYAEVLRNIGRMENRGVELSLSVNVIKKRNFNWVIDANWSTNQNKLTKANVPTTALYAGVLGNEEGENFNSFLMPIWAGVNAADGSAQWLDSSGNIVSQYPYAFKDKKFVGKSQPDGFGAVSTRLTMGSIELAASFYYQYGYQIYLENDLVNDGVFPYMNQDKRALNRWQKPGDAASNPKRVLNNPNGSGNFTPSSRYLFDGDHIRLQNVTLTWSVPKTFTDRLHFTGIRLFVQGNNLVVWSKYPDMDPGLVNTLGNTGNSSYPSQRTFSFGINANF